MAEPIPPHVPLVAPGGRPRAAAGAGATANVAR